VITMIPLQKNGIESWQLQSAALRFPLFKLTQVFNISAINRLLVLRETTIEPRRAAAARQTASAHSASGQGCHTDCNTSVTAGT